MDLYKFAWWVWIVGTILIVLSWNGTVSPTVGWVGFGIALVGVLLSFIPHLRQKLRGQGNREDWAVLTNAVIESKGHSYEVAMERIRRGGTVFYEGMAIRVRPGDDIACAVVASWPLAELDEVRVQQDVDRAKAAFEALTGRSPELAAIALTKKLRVSLRSEYGAKGIEICRMVDGQIEWKVKGKGAEPTGRHPG